MVTARTHRVARRTTTIRIGGEVVIGAPAGELFEFVADERNRYDPAVTTAELLTDGPVGRGTRFRTVAEGRGRPVVMTIEITGYQPPRRLDTTTRTASIDIHSTLEFEPLGPDRTRMRWSSHLEPRGPLRLLTPVLALVGGRRTRRIWRGLARQFEGRAAGPTPPTATPPHTSRRDPARRPAPRQDPP